MPLRAPRVALALLVAVLTLTACAYETRDVLPPIPDEAQSSRIYAADGTLLTVFHAEENRTNVPLADIPQTVQDAVIAIEDERFYQHKGVDLRAILRAARTNAESGTIAEGGSTITQQYVKIALLEDDEQTLARKIEEASVAYQLEQKYTKDRILELYLNTIYFGNGAYGVQAAAQEYFAKPATELTLTEAALIAGLIQAPSRHDPYKNPQAAVERRNTVIDRMAANGSISEDRATEAKGEPLQLTEPTPVLEQEYAAPYFVEHVKRWILRDSRFGETPEERRDLLFGGGLRIHTTVDLTMQFLADAAVNEVLPEGQDLPAAALVALDPQTGYVRAMAGGRDFFGDEAQKFNLATQARRQPGSAFKPIVLATALEDGISPQKVYRAPGRITLDQGPRAPTWEVENYGGGGGGAVTLIEATIRSYNTVFAQLMLDVGAEHAVERAKMYGIRSPIEAHNAAVLGSETVTPLDMASTYGTFANRGVHVEPVFVTRILNADGTVLYQHEHHQEKVLSVETADQLTDILRQNIERGTGTRAKLDRAAAGKTGTTSDWRDAWFAGYTPDIVTAVWVGYPERGRFMVPPATPIRVTGGSYPAQIWRAFMAPAHDGLEVREFPPPPTTTTTVPPPSRPTTTSLPDGEAIVPSLIGLSWGEAEAAVTDNGFVAARVDVADEDEEPDHVVGQDPPAGTTVAAGSTITVEVRAP